MAEGITRKTIIRVKCISHLMPFQTVLTSMRQVSLKRHKKRKTLHTDYGFSCKLQLMLLRSYLFHADIPHQPACHTKTKNAVKLKRDEIICVCAN